MIEIQVTNNEIKNSIKTQELFDYLLSKGHDLSVQTKHVSGVKVDLITGIALATLGVTTLGLLYPIIKDLQNWVRPRRYTLTISDGDLTGIINDLTQDEYLELVKKLNQNKIKIEITDGIK